MTTAQTFAGRRPTAETRRGPGRGATLGRVLAGVALVVALGACGDDGDATARDTTVPTTVVSPTPAATMPSWLEAVQPLPTGDAAPERAVEVEYGTLEVRRELRVIVDGVDVTSQLDGLKDVSPLEGELFPSPGRVRYDPRELENPLAPLGPGEHEARVELVEVPEFGAQGRVVDQYAWSFEVQ